MKWNWNERCDNFVFSNFISWSNFNFNKFLTARRPFMPFFKFEMDDIVALKNNMTTTNCNVSPFARMFFFNHYFINRLQRSPIDTNGHICISLEFHYQSNKFNIIFFFLFSWPFDLDIYFLLSSDRSVVVHL